MLPIVILQVCAAKTAKLSDRKNRPEGRFRLSIKSKFFFVRAFTRRAGCPHPAAGTAYQSFDRFTGGLSCPLFTKYLIFASGRVRK